MTTQAAAGGFISTCPCCDWHIYSSSRDTAVMLLGAHRCKEGDD